MLHCFSFVDSGGCCQAASNWFRVICSSCNRHRYRFALVKGRSEHMRTHQKTNNEMSPVGVGSGSCPSSASRVSLQLSMHMSEVEDRGWSSGDLSSFSFVVASLGFLIFCRTGSTSRSPGCASGDSIKVDFDFSSKSSLLCARCLRLALVACIEFGPNFLKE